MADAYGLLQRNTVLRQGSPRALAAAAKESEVLLYSPGSTVVRVGLPQTHVLLIAEGAVELFRRSRTAGTQMLMGVLEVPAIFGDAEHYSGSDVWHETARALVPTTVVAIPNRVFDQLVENDGKIAAGLYRDACARHMLVIDLLQIFALQSLGHKILRLLWGAASRGKSGAGPLSTPLSPVKLARALGVSAKTVARHLAEMERKGLVRRDGREIALLIPDNDLFFGKDLGKHGAGAIWKLPIPSAQDDAE